MDEFTKILLRDFVAENWVAFEDFCQERETDPDHVYEELGGE